MCSYEAIVASAIVLCERNFRFNLLQTAIEIREIISDVNEKDTPRFAGKNFVSTGQRYHKIVACLLAN